MGAADTVDCVVVQGGLDSLIQTEYCVTNPVNALYYDPPFHYYLTKDVSEC